MEEGANRLVDKVQGLSDIELAVLLCLVAEQHCIIETDRSVLDDVEKEIQLISSDVFGLTCAVLDCSDATTLDDFGSGILVKDEHDDYFGTRNGGVKGDFFTSINSASHHDRKVPKSSRAFSPLEGSRKIANIVVAKNLDQASAPVQTQALELVRGKRIFTRTAVYTSPTPFLFIALGTTGNARFNLHLNDHFFISHKHQIDDGLPNLEDQEVKDLVPDDDNTSNSSVVKASPFMFEKRNTSSLSFSQDEITQLTKLSSEVRISSDVRAYLHNIVVFMRLHRAVAGGISAMATRHFDLLSHALAPLHGLTYVTPSLVALAARKIYPHRIGLALPSAERSMQWGSSIEAVKAVLGGVTAEDVIEEVLQSVEAPL
ncbi:hypothetical protein BU24DRAFT_415961 [Aaosphaeria arxii CBS 175.79]|uniref:magnesium chelatase n=1 Tax=Aaosphaeria arxii CBS 175.79 TaxID=1450172 RepID=A0A6A5X644_9PLEO|nr:uncharacterized protein BU24DRAFT_415961 [Aaosphaeria arxii CBS 175.79]KAF2008419.1 hypothetical protein BU24DRAFT_415961 [Aaosphaeria arxii CBS 175.79]